MFKNCPQWKSQQKTLWGNRPGGGLKLPGPTRGRDRTKIAEVFADERCSQAILDFLATTDIGRTAGLPVQKGEKERSARPRSGKTEEQLALLREEEWLEGRSRRIAVFLSVTLYFL